MGLEGKSQDALNSGDESKEKGTVVIDRGMSENSAIGKRLRFVLRIGRIIPAN